MKQITPIYSALVVFLLFTWAAKADLIQQLGPPTYEVTVYDKLDTILSFTGSTPIYYQTKEYFVGGTDVKIGYAATDFGAKATLSITQTAQTGGSAFTILSVVDYPIVVVEVKKPPVPVNSVPLVTSYNLTAQCGTTNKGEIAIAEAFTAINDAQTLPTVCSPITLMGTVLKTVQVGVVGDVIQSATVEGEMNYDLNLNDPGGVVANAVSDPNIEIDPSFPYKDYFAVELSDTTEVPEPLSSMPCGIALVIALSVSILRGKQRSSKMPV